MSTDALDIYREHLNEQMSENGSFTEPAVIDPSGELEVSVYGIFDENYIQENKDGGNAKQKNITARFYLSELPLSYDDLLNLDIQLTYRDETYSIDYVSKDAEGLNVLWLV